MKFFIQKENLLYALQVVQRAVSAKSPLPALTGICFHCAKDVLTLTATDFDLSIRCTVPVNMEEEGTLILPAKYITEFTRRLPDTMVTIESRIGNNMAVIRYANSEFNINGYHADDFPVFHIPEAIFSLQLNGETLRNLFKQVLFAISVDDSRPIFTGMLFEMKDKEITLVTTDTYRMAVKRDIMEQEIKKTISVLIPGKTIQEFIRNSDYKDEVTIIIGETHAAFISENTTIMTRLIMGKFPSYQQVIPEKFTTEIKIDLQEFLNAAERVSLLAGESNSTVNLQVEEEILLLTIRSETGWIREEIKAEVNGPAMDIAYNVKYLCDVLKAIHGDTLILKLTSPLTPSLFVPANDENFLSILVPVKLNKE